MLVGDEGRRRFILDAMVLVAGLTSRHEPASYSRRLGELAIDGVYELVVTEILLEEVYDVLVDPTFVGRVTEREAAALVEGLATVASILIKDEGLEHVRVTDDPDDDYLAHAALQTGAYLVTRDDGASFQKVDGLESGRPGTALRLLGALGEGQPG